jgi:hypothetical protein
VPEPGLPQGHARPPLRPPQALPDDAAEGGRDIETAAQGQPGLRDIPPAPLIPQGDHLHRAAHHGVRAKGHT